MCIVGAPLVSTATTSRRRCIRVDERTSSSSSANMRVERSTKLSTRRRETTMRASSRAALRCRRRCERVHARTRIAIERDHEVARWTNNRDSPENTMAEAAPITPKNGEYTGAASVAPLIVAWFVGSQRRSGRSREMYLQVARESVVRDRRTWSDLHVTHVAKLVAHCQIWPTGEYSGAGHVMSDERSTRGGRWPLSRRVASVARRLVGRSRRPANRAPRLIPSRLTLGRVIG
jgi:hypothetical protein